MEKVLAPGRVSSTLAPPSLTCGTGSAVIATVLVSPLLVDAGTTLKTA